MIKQNQTLISQIGIFVDEVEARIFANPTHQQLFSTYEIINCVAVAIVTGQHTVFAPVFGDVIKDKPPSFEIFYLYKEMMAEQKRRNERVFLLSVYHSKLVFDIYKRLKESGFTHIAGDIGPILRVYGLHTEHHRVNTLKDFIEISKPTDLETLDNNLQKDFPTYQKIALIINVKTGELYSLKGSL